MSSPVLLPQVLAGFDALSQRDQLAQALFTQGQAQGLAIGEADARWAADQVLGPDSAPSGNVTLSVPRYKAARLSGEELDQLLWLPDLERTPEEEAERRASRWKIRRWGPDLLKSGTAAAVAMGTWAGVEGFGAWFQKHPLFTFTLEFDHWGVVPSILIVMLATFGTVGGGMLSAIFGGFALFGSRSERYWQRRRTVYRARVAALSPGQQDQLERCLQGLVGRMKQACYLRRELLAIVQDVRTHRGGSVA